MPAPKSPPPVRVRYVGPMPEVDVPTLGLVNVARGDVVEVPAEAAGQGPFWRPLADGEERHVTREHREVDDGAGGVRVEVRDLGSGLLSQLGNWELADATPPAASSTPVSSTAGGSAVRTAGGDR